MSKVYCLILALLLVSLNTHAYEPVLDHQGLLYFNLIFDIDQSKKAAHDFGFRFDRSFVQPHEPITMNQLNSKPAVFNLKLNSNGLQAFNVNGIDYSYTDSNRYVYYQAEGGDVESGGEAEAQPIPETDEAPERKIDIPLGVVIGVLIGAMAAFQ